ncbi:MAG TPA: hypothetical protein ENH34_03615 [Phycisphaerales bacterium]|nr:hypothetical protein [Phycisphaerales bacterium]
MSGTPSRIVELVETFDRNIEAYKNRQYNEAQVRREFIDPFFEALGWDIPNIKGYAQAYKEVIHEATVKIGSATKAPDYSFRIGGVRKFFLEAKKPSIDIKGDPHPAYQLRRYAWSAKLPVSILTDFEEFAVYDCQTRPKSTDKAGTARIMYFNYKEYIERWDEIENVFSREAILKGSFDKFTAATKGKRGTSTVDIEFLAEIEKWRKELARYIALRNRELSRYEINFAVQRTIDRILFLRMCEDRAIESYGHLLALVNGSDIYQRLCRVFERADEKYNSGLFHFKPEKGRAENPDELTLNLVIDDIPIKWILSSLYYPQSPYEFSVLPAEILGNVYEQFLGKVIRLTAGRQVKIEEKPEVKKAGGVYYTPAYIVDYIVKNTVGRLLGASSCHCEERSDEAISNKLKTKNSKFKTPTQVANLRILDPACGSGSFLLGAYTYLLNYLRDWYVDNNPQKYTKQIYQGKGGQWYLTIAEKKKILLNNIFGVDIDSQAVEVTKLSLLLKVLENESQETLRLFPERALPDLANNIKCGNSLIGPDFYESLVPGPVPGASDEPSIPDDLQRRINPFDWQTEFPEIFSRKNLGFDAVIGNPPWISLTGKFGAGIYPKVKIEYLIRKFAGNTYMPNMYEYFVTQGLNLLAIGGYFGYIVPDRLGFNSQFVELRNRILSQTQIISLIYRVPFPVITADTLMFVLHRTKKINPKSCVEIGEYRSELLQIPQLEFEQNPAYSFQYYDSVGAMKLIRKLECLPDLLSLSSICETTSGFGGESKLLTSTKVSPTQIKTIKGHSIGRYTFKRIYWFDFKRENITGRTTDKTKLGAKPKILLRKTGDRILATFDDSGIFPEQSLYFLFNNRSCLDFKYLLGILNSTLVTFYYRNRLITNRRSIAQLKKVDLDVVPIRTIDFDNPEDKAMHDKMVKFVERMLDLHKKLAMAKVPAEKTRIQRQINTTDSAIDKLVYKLYNLTPEEIAIVENANR